MSTVRRLVLAFSLLGCAATTAAGGGWAAALSAVVILGCMVRLPEPTPQAIERWRLVNLTLLLAALILLAVQANPLIIIASGLALLAAHRAWTAHQPAGLQALVLVVFLQVVLAARVVVSPWVPVMVGALVLLAPAALSLIALGAWRWRTAAIGAAAGGVGLLIAALIPAPPGPEVHEEIHAVGFSREITLGDLSPLHDDLTEILVLTLPDAPDPGEIYLHGITLDRFTGSGWSSTAPLAAVPLSVDLVGQPLVRQHIALQPLTEGVLPGIAPLASVEGLGGVWRDDVGTWRHTGAIRPVTYTAFSLADSPKLPLASPGRWLGLPADLDPRIRTLAGELAIDAGPAEQAEHLIRWLLEGFTYTRIPAPQTARQPLSDFLFVTRTGHCEYFAASLAVLLRAQGIPSRVVNGLRGGEEVEDGALRFRQRDAHAWVELYLPGQGWQRLDPTPPAAPEDLPPVDSLSAAALPVLPRVEVPVLPLLSVLMVGGLVGVARLRRREEPGLALYRRACRLVRRRGYALPALPPVAAAEWLIGEAGEAAEPMRTLAWALYRHRYGSDAEALSEMNAAMRLLRRLPKRG